MQEEHREMVMPGGVKHAYRYYPCVFPRIFTYSACFTSPISTAHTAICAREEKASLDKMAPTWVSTVR